MKTYTAIYTDTRNGSNIDELRINADNLKEAKIRAAIYKRHVLYKNVKTIVYLTK